MTKINEYRVTRSGRGDPRNQNGRYVQACSPEHAILSLRRQYPGVVFQAELWKEGQERWGYKCPICQEKRRNAVGKGGRSSQ